MPRQRGWRDRGWGRPSLPGMEHETYLATMAQLLPVLTLAAALELRFYVRKATPRQGAAKDFTWWYQQLYARALILATWLSLLCAVSCANALRTGEVPGYLFPVLDFAFPFTAVAIGVPLIAGIVDPRSMTRWYEDEKD